MAKNKIIASYDDADRKILELAKLQSVIAKEEAAMNGKINEVKEKFDERTKDLRAQAQLIEQEISDFATVNKADFMKERTKKLVHGSISFKTNPPKVSLLNRKYNNNTVIELIRKVFPGKYVRMKEEINKEQILIDYSEKSVDDEKLAGIGLKVDQDETFSIDIDWEKLQQESNLKLVNAG